MMNELFTDRQRAFHGQAPAVTLPPLPAQATADFLDDRFASTGKDLGTALDPLLDATAGHPHALTLVLTELNDEFRALWSGLPTAQRRVLTLVGDETTGPFSRAAPTDRGRGTRHALDTLLERADITTDPTSVSRYRVVDPMLAAWLRAGRS